MEVQSHHLLLLNELQALRRQGRSRPRKEKTGGVNSEISTFHFRERFRPGLDTAVLLWVKVTLGHSNILSWEPGFD